ncbi:MAG: methyltransferase domain-containing protein [Deltaproteobacteria bacterium]|nr:methyltransferase domain-containing protein [Deltaproteobacteria bacterium]
MSDLRALGQRLVAAGLTPRALAAWSGTDRISSLPWKVSDLSARDPVPAASGLALLVAGAELPLDRVRRLPIDELVAAGLVETIEDRVRARVAIVPLGASLLVCDRAECDDGVELVCWPDDSSVHLARALPPGRRSRWLDLGCGSAFAPLARPELATAIVGVDINPRAVEHARLGAGLSGIEHLRIERGDVLDDWGSAELVTCNAPIPDEPDAAVWRSADAGFFVRLWSAARRSVAPGGEIIVHCTLSAIPEELPGEQLIVVYTPPSTKAFAILWWRPDAPSRRVVGRRAMTPERPHVDLRDRDDAAAGALMPRSSC